MRIQTTCLAATCCLLLSTPLWANGSYEIAQSYDVEVLGDVQAVTTIGSDPVVISSTEEGDCGITILRSGNAEEFSWSAGVPDLATVCLTLAPGPDGDVFIRGLAVDPADPVADYETSFTARLDASYETRWIAFDEAVRDDSRGTYIQQNAQIAWQDVRDRVLVGFGAGPVIGNSAAPIPHVVALSEATGNPSGLLTDWGDAASQGTVLALAPYESSHFLVAIANSGGGVSFFDFDGTETLAFIQPSGLDLSVFQPEVAVADADGFFTMLATVEGSEQRQLVRVDTVAPEALYAVAIDDEVTVDAEPFSIGSVVRYAVGPSIVALTRVGADDIYAHVLSTESGDNLAAVPMSEFSDLARLVDVIAVPGRDELVLVEAPTETDPWRVSVARWNPTLESPGDLYFADTSNPDPDPNSDTGVFPTVDSSSDGGCSTVSGASNRRSSAPISLFFILSGLFAARRRRHSTPSLQEQL